MRRVLAVLGWLVLFPAAITTLAAATDHLHPALDSLGVGLVYGMSAAAVGALAFVLAGRRLSACLACAILILSGLQLLPLAGLQAAEPAQPLRLTQHNLKFSNPAVDLPARIAQADLVALQEVRDAVPTLATLDDDWTVQTCPFAAVGNSAALTRLPVTDRGCFEGGAWLRVDTAHRPVTLASLHLHWPWPKGQVDHVTRVMATLTMLPRPVVVAGDFNQTPWSATVARIAAATGTAPIPSLATTLPLTRGLVQLNIDHVLIPLAWSGTLTVTDRHGSDHTAQLARIGPMAQ
ncbi:MAG: endonuclease/exonuclease/phosphatase family protein [Pseudomonadota bacterium]